MSSIDDDDRSTLSTSTSSISFLQPVTTDKTPIVWDGNDATIDGTLFETGRFYKKTGLFQPLFKHRAVALSSGRLAVESPNTVYFLNGLAPDDGHSFEKPCPPTKRRLANYNDEVALGTFGKTAVTLPELVTIPAADKGTIIPAQYAVDKENSVLLTSLAYVFGSADSSDEIFDEADGNGAARNYLRVIL